MGIVVRRGDLRDGPNKEYRETSILLDVIHADSQAQANLRGGSADHDESAASTSEAYKRQHYSRPGHVSFNERNHKLATLALESFGGLGVEGSKFVDQLPTGFVGGRDGVLIARKGVVKERLLKIVSVTTQVPISSRVSRFKLQHRDTKKVEGKGGAGTTDPHRWRVDGAWMQLLIRE